jgi:superfamily II DNA or RNA helicase
LLGTIRHRLAQSISKIPTPPTRSINKWLKVPTTHPRIFEIPETSASDNICLKITDSIIATTVLAKEDDGTISLLIDQIGEETQVEVLAIGESFEKLKHLTSTVTEDLLPLPPSVARLDSRLTNLPEIFGPKVDTLITRTDVHDFSHIALLSPAQVSNNIFSPLGKRAPHGKDYRRFERGQQSLFGNFKTDTDQATQRIRKAYTTGKTQYSTFIKQQNFWDLLFPLLQPPLTLEVSEEFDLYQPLYGYQQKGIEFLIENTSALLADEMGTGKTVQAIVALRILFREAKVRHALVLCPPAVLGSAYLSQITGKPEGWDGHFHKWAPELTVTVVRGNPEQRRLDWSCPAHVYLSTYDTLRNDLENGILEEQVARKFDCVIADEAQNIKNRDAGRAKAVRMLDPVYRWALTGTPIENKVEDVISIFAFVRPKLFSREYYPPHEVKDRISPYFLRRLKKDVLKDLPEKIREDVWLELDDDQRAAYEEVLETGRRFLSEKVETENEFQLRGHIFTLLHELKQICNFAPNRSQSPKTEALADLVETIAQNNQKVLIYSQYSKYGIKKLEEFLHNNSIKFVTYEGGMSDVERNRAIHSFKAKPEITVFLGAVRAAGFGLTLTEASYVIHFDHWWNPATMWQAEDRAHRPGQKNKLNIYSFWMRDTIEQKIRQKLHEKGLLIKSVIDSLAIDAIEEMITTAEWLEMLGVKKHGRQEGSAETQSLENILDHLSQVSPTEFENIAREFFVKQGYTNAKVTQRSHDGGVDVFGSRKRNGFEESFIAQCKRTSSVGVKVARELLGVLAANPTVTNGFLITSGDFTEECLRFAEGIPKLTLINGITFANFLRQFKIL